MLQDTKTKTEMQLILESAWRLIAEDAMKTAEADALAERLDSTVAHLPRRAAG